MVDMHTNGMMLAMTSTDPAKVSIHKLIKAGLTKITFSIAHLDPDINKKLMGVKQDVEMLLKAASVYGLLTRVSLVLAKDGVHTFEQVVDFIQKVGDMGAHMVVVRELWIPHLVNPSNEKVAKWCDKNYVSLAEIEEAFHNDTSVWDKDKVGDRYNMGYDPDASKYGLIRGEPLPWGPPVYGMEGVFKDPNHGVNITFARCEQNAKGPVLKSIVHRPNGHGYVNWDSNCFILY